MKFKTFRFNKVNSTNNTAIRIIKNYNYGDKGRIADETPTLGDIHRMIAENFTAFYTGERSIDEYDDFLAELDDAGMQDWINAMTAQMQESWAN